MNNRVCNELPAAFYSCDYLTRSLILSMSTVRGRRRSSETQTDTHTYFHTHTKLHMNCRHTKVFANRNPNLTKSHSQREVRYTLGRSPVWLCSGLVKKCWKAQRDPAGLQWLIDLLHRKWEHYRPPIRPRGWFTHTSVHTCRQRYTHTCRCSQRLHTHTHRIYGS